jgi:hypothetical protein
MANGFSLHLEQDSLPVPETGGNPVAITIRAGSARITRLSLEDGELVITIKAELADASLEAGNLPPSPPGENPDEFASPPEITAEQEPVLQPVSEPEIAPEKNLFLPAEDEETAPPRYGEPEREIEAAAVTDFFNLPTPAVATEEQAEKNPEPDEEEPQEKESVEETKPEPFLHLQTAPATEQQITHIRYTCPRCHQPGEKEIGTVGSIVTCGNCGRAMRLTFKK